MSDATDRGRGEFLSEAEEIVETLGRDLVALDEAQRAGRIDPDVVNDLFRGVHTLKGLSGLFGAQRLGALSHELEGLLDGLRLGRAPLTREAVDRLFAAVDMYHRLLVVERDAGAAPVRELDELLASLRGEGAAPKKATASLDELDLDPGIFAVLTEYEEHRLRVNVEAGVGLFRLRVRFSLATIDESLDKLKAAAKPHGEIITYLPTGEGADIDAIELEILLASARTLAELEDALGNTQATILPVGRAARPAAPAATPMLTPSPALARSSSAPPPDARRDEKTVRSVTQTVRVDIHKLDRLMNIVSELAIVRSSIERLFERFRPVGDRRAVGELARLSRTFERQLEAMQQGILEVRMVPLGQLFERLSRVARQVSRDGQKQFNLVVTGAETEIDKLIVEELSDPLMHMMRNAIDHGIEPVAERLEVGKPEAGTVALNAFQKGNHVVIELEDDGRGIDTEHIMQLALEKGFVNPADVRSTSRRDILQLIFLPGLSTRSSPGEMSGRGVGMDVVKTNIAKLGGIVDVQSEVGIGTKFTITLPITLAIIRVLVAEVGEHVFAVPIANVREAVPLGEGDVFRVDGHEAMSLRGATLRLSRLREVFEIGEAPPGGRSYVIVTSVGKARLGLVVDRLVGGQDVVMKPLGPSLRDVRGFAGAAELGEERLGLVLDTPALLEEATVADKKRPLLRGGIA